MDVFSFHNQFWFLGAYLVRLNLSIHSNQPQALKITFEILVTHNMKNVFSIKIRILGSNLFLARE
jgi:hypothetical protein